MTKNKAITHLIIAAVILFLMAIVMTYFLRYHQDKIEAEGGIAFDDPILRWIKPGDVSLYIFILTYGSLLSYLFLHIRKITYVTHLMYGYSILLILRIISMTLLPLNEPEGIVRLEDPFLNGLIYDGNITTDLFFSGHLATVLLIAFLSRYRIYFIIAAVALSYLILVQHIHYSIDLLAAIPVSFAIARFVKYMLPIDGSS